jgi:hypothetical protein
MQLQSANQSEWEQEKGPKNQMNFAGVKQTKCRWPAAIALPDDLEEGTANPNAQPETCAHGAQEDAYRRR